MDNRNDTNFLRFLAIILVVNSHLDSFYPINFLATGGAIGNALFFMLSGFGLSLSAKNKSSSFLTWYTRRIIKIYPAVWLTVLFLILPISIIDKSFIGDDLLSFVGNLFYPPFWFLRYLLFLYIFAFYLIKHYNFIFITIVLCLLCLAYCLFYCFVLDISKFTVQNLKDSPFVLIIYAIIFVFGIMLSRFNNSIRYTGIFDIVALIILLTLFYFHKYLMYKSLFIQLQFIQDMLLIPMIYLLLKISRSKFISHLLMKSIMGNMIEYISSISLLLYIVHSTFGSKIVKLAIKFPLNILLYVGTAFIIAVLFDLIIERYIRNKVNSL